MPVRPQTVDFRELEGLPAPVQHFFRAVLEEGQPVVAGVRVRPLSRASVVAGGWLPSALIDATREVFGDLESDLGRYVRHSGLPLPGRVLGQGAGLLEAGRGTNARTAAGVSQQVP